MINLENLKPTKELCVFFVCTENEIINEGVESTLWSYLNLIPSVEWKIDIFIFLNKIVDTKKIEIIIDRVEKNPWVNKLEVVSLDLCEKEDVFWYPWLKTPKPKVMPEYGYTSGANLLFYRSIRLMMGKKENYKNLLMLEADSIPLQKNWFDKIFNFCKENDFEIAGSKYKGDQECHYESEYKDHLNGIAIYRNSEKLEEILKGGEEIIKNKMPPSGYLNFDIANFLFYKNHLDKYTLLDIEMIINMSDPRDFYIEESEVLDRYPKSLILHKKSNKNHELIDEDTFDQTEGEDLPVCLLQPHCGSEYILDISLIAARQYLKKDSRYTKAVKLKIITDDGARIIIFAVCKEYFDAYPRSFFQEIDFNCYSISFFNLAKLIEDKYIKILSICLDFRSTTKLNKTIFNYFKAIIKKTNKSPYLYLFHKDHLDLAGSSFIKHELLNHHRIIENKEDRDNAFLSFLQEDFSPYFLQKCFFQREVLNEYEESFLFYILSKFQIFDTKIIDEILYRIYKQTYNIEIELNHLNIANFNSTVGKVVKVRDEMPAETNEILDNKCRIHNIIYREMAIKDLGTENLQNDSERKVPTFLHIPKNAGSFIISAFTKYFTRMHGGDRYFNIQRMQVDFDDCSHATFFILFKNDIWKNDPRIRKYRHDAPRSRSSDIDTLIEYIKDDKASILAAVAEPAVSESEGCCGKICPKVIVKSLENIWMFFKKINVVPFNFTILRDPLDRAISLYNYITSERSQHEDTHGVIKQKNIQEYLESDSTEDSWIIRALNEIGNNSPIEHQHLDNALDFLIENNFLVKDISDSDNILKEVIESCYEQKIIPQDINTATKNDNKEKKKNPKNTFPKKTIEAFQARASWDQAFYSKIIR
tara:strand:+ start:9543 stop:12161 length:2619 start_codon:yes stop_codon:yes gene_type:complete